MTGYVCTAVCLSSLLADGVSGGFVLCCVLRGFFGHSGCWLLFFCFVFYAGAWFSCVLSCFFLLYCVYYWFLFLGFLRSSYVYGLPDTGIFVRVSTGLAAE